MVVTRGPASRPQALRVARMNAAGNGHALFISAFYAFSIEGSPRSWAMFPASAAMATSTLRLNSAPPYATHAWPPMSSARTRCLERVERTLRIGFRLNSASERDESLPEPCGLPQPFGRRQPDPAQPLAVVEFAVSESPCQGEATGLRSQRQKIPKEESPRTTPGDGTGKPGRSAMTRSRSSSPRSTRRCQPLLHPRTSSAHLWWRRGEVTSRFLGLYPCRHSVRRCKGGTPTFRLRSLEPSFS